MSRTSTDSADVLIDIIFVFGAIRRTAALPQVLAERARGALIPQKLQTKLRVGRIEQSPVAEMLASEPNDPTDRSSLSLVE